MEGGLKITLDSADWCILQRLGPNHLNKGYVVVRHTKNTARLPFQ